MSEERKIIRAADYLPKPKTGDDDHSSLENYEMTSMEYMLFGIFGETPHYNDPEFEAIWQAIFDNDNHEEIIRFCREKGIDVIGDNGEPVRGWRDIAVMLTAIDKGILTVSNEQ